MNIDTNAPLHARRDIFITAPIEKVWSIQTDLEHWHEWQSDIAFVKLEGPLAPGTVFRWKGGGLNIVSTLQQVEPLRRVGWTGNSIGMKAIHNWMFQSEANGTRVITEESLSGWLAQVLKMFDANFLDKSLEKSLETLKAKAEKA